MGANPEKTFPENTTSRALSTTTPAARQIVSSTLDGSTDVAVAEVVSGDGDSSAVRPDAERIGLHDRERVGADGAPVRVAQVDSGSVVGDDVGRNGVAVTIAIEDDGGSGALFDHVAGDDRAVGVFDDHAVTEVVVEIVAGHTQIETVDAVQRVLVFFELIGGNDNVVTAEQVEPGAFVIGDERVAHAGVFVAMVEADAVFTVIRDGDSVDEDLFDLNRFDSVTAVFVTGDSKVGKLYAPQAIRASDFIAVGMGEYEGPIARFRRGF